MVFTPDGKATKIKDLNPEAWRLITKPILTQQELWDAFQSLTFKLFGTSDLSKDYEGDLQELIKTELLQHVDPELQAEWRDGLAILQAALNESLVKQIYKKSLSNNFADNKKELMAYDLVWLPIPWANINASAELIALVKSKLIEYPGPLGPEREKLYLHVVLFCGEKRPAVCPMGTSMGKGTARLPWEIRRATLRVIGPDDPEFDQDIEPGEVIDKRPPLRLYGRHVERGQYLFLIPRYGDYGTYMSTADDYFDDEGMALLHYYGMKATQEMWDNTEK